MNKRNRVSVVIPIYNMAEHLRECLDSAVRQTLKDIQIVCVNDGSTDESGGILAEYARSDSRILVITQENQGVGRARNAGMDVADGEFIAFLDADDRYASDSSLELLYSKACAFDVPSSAGSFCEDRGGRLVTRFPSAFRDYVFKEGKVVQYRDFQFDYGFQRFIFRLDRLRESNIRFPPYARFQDPPFFVRAMATLGRFYSVPDVTYVYRYGYKTLVWDKEKTSDLVRGLKDNLQFSRDAKLERLHAMTVRRLNIDYISALIRNMDDPEFIQLLEDAERTVDPRLLELAGMKPEDVSTIFPLNAFIASGGIERIVKSNRREQDQAYKSGRFSKALWIWGILGGSRMAKIVNFRIMNIRR